MNTTPPRTRPFRRASYIIVKYHVNEGTYRDVIKNIGAGGLFIRTSRRISAGQTIVLEFPLFDFDKTIQIAGKVARKGQNGFAVVFDKPLSELLDEDGQIPRLVHEGDR